MAATTKTLYLYETRHCTRHGEAQVEGLDVFFPDDVDNWTDVLDCRIAPYTEYSLQENCEYAVGVRKKFILVTEAQVAQEGPPTPVE